jgi:hypothetical protein
MRLVQRIALLGVPLILAPATATASASGALAATAGDTDIATIVVQPKTTQVNEAMMPAVVVDVEEPNGAIDPDYNGPVTLSYAVNKIGAPEPANNVATAVQGVAEFPRLTFGAVGFGFALQASIPGATSAPSAPFDIVDQLLRCRPGRSCQSETVRSAGTSAYATAAPAPSSDLLAATGGGFPRLSCTSIGGVVSFSVPHRPKVITVMLAKRLVLQVHPRGARSFNICWGSPAPFITKNGTTSAFNPANNEFEGLLPDCGRLGPQPCILQRHRDRADQEVITVAAPPGDPHITS